MSWFSKPLHSVSLSQRRRLVLKFLIFSDVSDGHSSDVFVREIGLWWRCLLDLRLEDFGVSLSFFQWQMMLTVL
jgi:hypothetical protein